MHRRQYLPQAQKLLVVFEISDPPAALEIAGVGRAAHRTENQPVAAEDESALRVAAMEVEYLRRFADLRFDQIGGKADAVAVRRRIGAGLLQQRPGFVVQDIDADFLEHGQRRPVDRLEFVVRDRGHRIEQPARLRPDRSFLTLRFGVRYAAAAPAAAAASLGRHRCPFVPHRAVRSSAERPVAGRIRPKRRCGHAESAGACRCLAGGLSLAGGSASRYLGRRRCHNGEGCR